MRGEGGELGGGGMSRVFVAEDRALARPVVIKVLQPELAAPVRWRRHASTQMAGNAAS